MIQITHPDLDKLADRHWEAIRNYVQKIGKSDKINTNIGEKLPDYNFKKLVLAKPHELDALAAKNPGLTLFLKSY